VLGAAVFAFCCERTVRNQEGKNMQKVITLFAAILVFSLCNPAKATLDTPPVVWEKTFGGSYGD
jgi:hypothetical protein